MCDRMHLQDGTREHGKGTCALKARHSCTGLDAHTLQEKFEEIFSKHDKNRKGGLYYWDMLRIMRTNMNVRSLAFRACL